eukprot:TRINITY_DN24918_c0_g1_i2.p1 TRINITY_DN24918_c0_g1~~TRINITY_DN24918_c0_g1_i2.p1  ORF type:complete len:406 (-),score=85.76 TRINITY_DN24918_c0_g1_i2:73-1236(-)
MAAIPIEHGKEELVSVGTVRNAPNAEVKLWCRIWGNRLGVPVLFVHGGPGQCVADYNNINKDFFEAERFFVIEVDQRGTGKSQPSVRDNASGVENMHCYLDISLEQMSADYEVIRKHLDVDSWLVFGGSWGSTLALDYSMRYPQRCLGLIVRGLFLGTAAEADAVYQRGAFEVSEEEAVKLPPEVLERKRLQLAEFDVYAEYALREEARQHDRLDKQRLLYSTERMMRHYESLILKGDRSAIWRFYVFENNLMAEEASDLLDYHHIDEEIYLEAQSVSFFEARLFLRLAYEDPPDLLGRVEHLKDIPTWVVQGTGDAVCPERFAQELVEALRQTGHTKLKAQFVDAGHKASADNIKVALKQSVAEFLASSARSTKASCWMGLCKWLG